jgi:hypothetical protein
MPIVRKWGDEHISRVLRQVRPDLWLLGSFSLQRVPYHSETATWYDENDGSNYILKKLSNPHPPATPHY